MSAWQVLAASCIGHTRINGYIARSG